MKKLEKRIASYLKERGWDKLRPSDLAKSILIEGAELLEHFQWENASLEEVKKDKEKMKEIKKELADILIYSLDMAVLLEIDAEKIILEKLEYISKKYPAHIVKKDSKKEPGAGKEYLRIKKLYRRKGL
jgi:NTP pyrophosphatase (non-canonical NTP hydrolase)